MASSQHYYPGPDQCLVYWDYENISIPHRAQLRTVISVLKQRIWHVIDQQIPIRFKLYIRASKLTQQLQDEMDVNGVEHINISSQKPESVDKRMLVDIALTLYELEKCKKSNCIALISGDKDFGHLLSRIHKQAPISHSLLILLNQNKKIDANLSNNVDFVINNFNKMSFKLCSNENCQSHKNKKCEYHHPANNFYNFSFNEQTKKNKKKRRRQKEIKQTNKRRKLNDENETDSSIEIMDKIKIKIQQIGTEKIEWIQINDSKNETVKSIKTQICQKHKNVKIESLRLRLNGIDLMQGKLEKYQIAENDSLLWFVQECNNSNNKAPDLEQMNATTKQNVIDLT